MDLQREETRKIYDHYEKKLEKLNDEKEKRIKKGTFQDNSFFTKKLERVIFNLILSICLILVDNILKIFYLI
jgi:hypothetical protein